MSYIIVPDSEWQSMRLQFGDVTFDPESRQVWRAGQEVHLSPKAFELLKLLLDRRPQAVPKADISERLWPGTFVSATNLPTLIAEIRDALGENAHQPRFLRTVHGFGYAFQSEVERSVEAPREDRAYGWLVSETAHLALFAGENILGREGPGVVILKSSTVSRRHARIVIDERGVVVVDDLGSKNGTYVNDRRVTSPMPVADGDRVRTGSLVFTFSAARPSSSTETQASRSGSSRTPPI